MPSGKPVSPPEIKEVPCSKTAHGVTWEDCYQWLEDKQNPEVREHLEKENAHTDSILSNYRELQDSLFRELVSRIEETSESAPYPFGDYIYKSRIEKGSDYRQYFRKRKSAGKDWEKYFDAQEEAGDKDYFDIAFLDVSPNGELLAYAIDIKGAERYCLKFRNLKTGTDLPEVIEDVAGEGEWSADSTEYYFLREDATRRPFQIYRHAIGSSQKQSRKIHEEKDSGFYLGISKSQDGNYLFAESESKETTEVSFLDLHSKAKQFELLFPRRTGIQYHVEHHNGSWLIRTNENAPDFMLVSCPAGKKPIQKMKVLIPARNGIRLEEMIPFARHLAVLERELGFNRICIINLTTGKQHQIPVQDKVYDLQTGINAEFETDKLNYTYSSPIRPKITLCHDMETKTSEVIHSVKVPSGHVPEDYDVYQLKACSRDGVEVPVTVIHKRKLKEETARPLYLYGYGAYGSVVTTNFNSSWLSYLERGFTVAIAHVRGGGLLGENWYQDGKLDKKTNTFHDFIAAAKELIRLNYTIPDRLVIEGGSAGGMLIGAVLNIQPQLFKAAVADVPFVDVLNTMMDDTLPLTTFEYEEWGNPAHKDAFENIRSYSPYENVSRRPYPSILAIAGFNDPRVACWEPAKWIARIRKLNPGGNPALLKTYFSSGHSGVSGRYDYLREIAFTQAFLISRVMESIQQD